MTNYNKMTVQDFRKKLKNGAYESATAARRGIGKMQGWSDAERDSARGAVAKHFGDEAPAKKQAAKGGKAPKKAVKKKAAKAKGAAKAKAKAKGAGKKHAAPAASAEQPKAAPRRSVAPESGSAVLDATIARYEKTVGIYKTAADALAQTAEGVDRKEALDNIADGLTRLMSRMTTEVVEPLEGKTATPVAPVPVAAPTPVVATPREVPTPATPAAPVVSNGVHDDTLPVYEPPPSPVGVVPPQI